MDWHLKPSGQRGALTQLMAAIDRAKERHGFWCLDSFGKKRGKYSDVPPVLSNWVITPR